jgi:hypothetical protein
LGIYAAGAIKAVFAALSFGAGIIKYAIGSETSTTDLLICPLLVNYMSLDVLIAHEAVSMARDVDYSALDLTYVIQLLAIVNVQLESFPSVNDCLDAGQVDYSLCMKDLHELLIKIVSNKLNQTRAWRNTKLSDLCFPDLKAVVEGIKDVRTVLRCTDDNYTMEHISGPKVNAVMDGEIQGIRNIGAAASSVKIKRITGSTKVSCFF